MSLSLSQGLQTCLETRLVEPRVLRLRLVPTSQALTSTIDGDGSWSSLLSQDINKEPETEKDRVYLHPQAKRSPDAPKLSAESLAMCTESLGSETGSDGEDISQLSLESPKKLGQPGFLRAKKHSRCNANSNFPPPLTSVNGFRVMAHREAGRLVLKAVSVSASDTNFLAERGDGRLRLHLLRERETGDLEGIDGNSGNFRGKMGMEKIQRPRSIRCKEDEHGNKFMCLLKPICLSSVMLLQPRIL